MLSDHIKNIILKKLIYSPTKDQETLIEGLSGFILDNDSNKIFLIKGYAGTGKTTMISALVNAFKELKVKSVLLAPTGRAAKVLTAYSKKSAYTIHKKIYRQKSSKDGFGLFVLDVNLHSKTFFIVDEASMISNNSREGSSFGSGSLLDDLIKYVYNDKSCKLILIGDVAQLPPVGLDISPALDSKELRSFGYDVLEYNLRDVVRQQEDSGILLNATNIRNLISSKNFVFPKLELNGIMDVQRISGSELIDTISDSYDKYGFEDTIIITRSNKRANLYNQGIRSQIMWHEEEIAVGDFIMVVKNNYYWIDDNDKTSPSTGKIDFIANGDIAEILKIRKYEERYGFRFVNVTLRFIDYEDIEVECKIILDTLNIDSAALSNEDNKQLYYNVLDDYKHEKNKKKQYDSVKNNEYFNALQVKFSYAITCHKAQGGQWKNVFIDHGFVNDDMMNKEYLRWLYTAFTRPIENLYLVNFDKRFFDPEDFD
ncbi:MAG: AAA family ATPase [Bacteroidales bacterium]|jgi:exodeoxyribonuclease-5|nr:AAA family ATPase [Bacteroidales bacterium]